MGCSGTHSFPLDQSLSLVIRPTWSVACIVHMVSGLNPWEKGSGHTNVNPDIAQNKLNQSSLVSGH